MTRLQRIRERSAFSTSGPWTVSTCNRCDTLHLQDHLDSASYDNCDKQPTVTEVDYKFIEAAREDVPFLLSLVEDLSAVVRRVQWSAADLTCPVCCVRLPSGLEHRERCALAAVLKKVEEE